MAVCKLKKCEVSLAMSQAEARTLKTILYHVGGCPKTSLRIFAASIDKALDKAHIQRYSENYVQFLCNDGVYFQDGSKVAAEH